MTTSTCRKCGKALTADNQYCPHCGTPTPYYNVSPYDPTEMAPDASQQKAPNNYDSPPHEAPHQNPYGVYDPYGGPPPPPRTRLIIGILIGIIVLLVLSGIIVAFTLTRQGANQANTIPTAQVQLTGTAQAQLTGTVQTNATATQQAIAAASATAQAQANVDATATATTALQGSCPTPAAVAQAIDDNAKNVSPVNGEMCAFKLQKVTQRTVQCPARYGEVSFEYTSVPNDATVFIRKCDGTQTTSFTIYGATVRSVNGEPDGDACTIYAKTPGSVLAETKCP